MVRVTRFSTLDTISINQIYLLLYTAAIDFQCFGSLTQIRNNMDRASVSHSHAFISFIFHQSKIGFRDLGPSSSRGLVIFIFKICI